MCGISGVIVQHDVHEQILEAMNAVLCHRGPDDSGTWWARTPHTTVGLAHRRLSIVDLSAAGHQPMTNEDGSLWLTYNGEIYNHADLRRELEPAGHTYRSHTDSETILHGYEHWGDQCVTRFRGMFAFAIWDAPRQRLFAARDRLGVKPLYYAQIGASLVFASEIKAILASGLIRARPAAGAVSEYLTFGYLAGNGTMFDNIHKLAPGHTLVWENGRLEVRPYWRLAFSSNRSDDERAVQTRFRTLFEESVRIRLMSDVPLGVFLSGGLDSSAIAAVMARQVAGPIKTFSVGYAAPHYSELPVARRVAGLIHAEHHEVLLTAPMFHDAMPRLVWHEDEPLWGTASVALYFVSKLATQHVKVVLTGEGSDELFAGYDRYWMTRWNARFLSVYGLLPASVRQRVWSMLRRALPASLVRRLSHTALRYDALPDELYFENWFGVWPPHEQRGIAGPALRDDLENHDVYGSHRQIFETSDARHLIDRLLATDIRSNLVELLMKQDQMSMAASIESRVPFLDHKLVEFAATVPVNMKIRGASGKHILKSAFEDLLPPQIRHRPKKGFPVPWEAWLRDGLIDRIEALLLSDRSLDRGWFDRKALGAMFADHRTSRRNLSRQIWSLWGLELWARACLDGEVPPPGPC